jgi:hypothetical protein
MVVLLSVKYLNFLSDDGIIYRIKLLVPAVEVVGYQNDEICTIDFRPAKTKH